jgi:membrane protein DedA with SNARE-associated domain
MFDWILSVISTGGYAGVFALMLLENLFPPIPSELIMPLAGFLAARGELDVVGVVLSGTLGSAVGALPWYWLGHAFGYDRVVALAERLGFWLTVGPEDVRNAHDWFRRKGWTAVLFGRLVPAIRTLISVPAGVAPMPLPLFMGLTVAGSLAWTSLLAGAGFILEDQYTRVEAFLEPGTKLVLAAILGIYLWRVASRLLRGARRRP